MNSHVMHILMTATLVACPLICRTGKCGASSGCCAIHLRCNHAGECPVGCSGSHAPAPDEQQDSAPAEHSSHPSYCQCLCGGALYDSSDSVRLVVKRLLDVVVNDSATIGLQVELSAIPQRPLSFAWVRSGRMVCCLHMSFLC